MIERQLNERRASDFTTCRETYTKKNRLVKSNSFALLRFVFIAMLFDWEKSVFIAILIKGDWNSSLFWKFCNISNERETHFSRFTVPENWYLRVLISHTLSLVEKTGERVYKVKRRRYHFSKSTISQCLTRPVESVLPFYVVISTFPAISPSAKRSISKWKEERDASRESTSGCSLWLDYIFCTKMEKCELFVWSVSRKLHLMFCFRIHIDVAFRDNSVNGSCEKTGSPASFIIAFRDGAEKCSD